MATTCPSCNTDNRPFAKYCIECVAALPATFAPTVLMAPADATSAVPLRAARSAAVPHAPTPPVSPRLVDEPATRSTATISGTPKPVARKGLWVSVAAFAIALLVGAGGWMVAGAGGWYIYRTATTPMMAGPAEPVISPGPGPSAPIAPVATATSAPAAPEPMTPMAIEKPAVAPRIASPARPTPTPAPAVAAVPRPSNAPTSTPREIKSRPAAAAAASSSGNPAEQCTGLGFFTMSRCMATQCAKPAYRRHPACEDVRRQQQLMEEKRNLSLHH